MVEFTQGNLLEAQTEAIVNTVNEVGVMGKGIAAMFRDAFPLNTSAYESAAKAHQIKVGKMFVTQNPLVSGPRWIINFPTKRHWRQPSRLEWIDEGLKDLQQTIKKLGIQSIAIPPLGCGNGGLNWPEVRAMMLEALEPLAHVRVVVYEPIAEYQPKPKATGVEKLTVARALIAGIVRQYGVLGFDCTILEVQKLAWFLASEIERAGLRDPLKLQFAADRYGPYDDRLRHLLNALDGSYLHAAKRLADATPYDLIWFDGEHAEALNRFLKSPQMRDYIPVLERTVKTIEGFESPFGMELLATVDWLIQRESVPPNVGSVRKGLSRWPTGEQSAQRKLSLFDERVLALAVERLVERHAASKSPTLFD